MDTVKTGTYLATLRKNANMTQQEVADRLGVSNKTVSKWESGGGFPDIAILPALAELYGVSADELLAGEPLPREQGGTSQVENFLHQRQTLRFRIGYAVAALCLLAAILFRHSLTAVQLLLVAAATAALWIGLGACPEERRQLRLVMLLPLSAAALWVLSNAVLAEPLATAMTAHPSFNHSNNLHFRLCLELPSVITIVLLPAAYILLRTAARLWGGAKHLLSRPYFWVLLVGWAAYFIEEVIRFIVIRPKALAYMSTKVSTSSSHFRNLSAELFGVWFIFEPLPWYIMGATAVALIVVAVVQFNRRIKK